MGSATGEVLWEKRELIHTVYKNHFKFLAADNPNII